MDFEFGFDSFFEPFGYLFDSFNETSTARVYCNVPSGEDSLLWGSSLDVTRYRLLRVIGLSASRALD